MTEARPPAPRDDAELAARIEAATRPAPWTPPARARFRAGVAERASRERAPRRALRWSLAASLAAGALWLALPQRSPAPSPPLAQGAEEEGFADSYEEQVLFAPEWIEGDAGFVDDDVLPESYAVASALIEP
jgi:hypothetical protein